VYQYPGVVYHYGIGTFLVYKTIIVTPSEVMRVTVGWGTDLGGDYTEDTDFWLDKQTFLETYTDIPERVVNLLNDLPEYQQSVDIDHMEVV
jgi:hypothetical protein